MTLVIDVRIRTLYVVRMVFVDGVIAKVHARVPKVLPCVVILDSGEPDEPLLVQVYDQGVVRGDQNIEAEVRFVTIYQQWVVNILPNHHWFIQRNLQYRKALYYINHKPVSNIHLIRMIHNKYSSSARRGHWLDNPGPCGYKDLIKLFSKWLSF